jgi:hypothetical protein
MTADSKPGGGATNIALVCLGARLNVERPPHQSQVPCQPSRMRAADRATTPLGVLRCSTSGNTWHAMRGCGRTSRREAVRQFSPSVLSGMFPAPAEKFALPLFGELPCFVKDATTRLADPRRIRG